MLLIYGMADLAEIPKLQVIALSFNYRNSINSTLLAIF